MVCVRMGAVKLAGWIFPAHFKEKSQRCGSLSTYFTDLKKDSLGFALQTETSYDCKT